MKTSIKLLILYSSINKRILKKRKKGGGRGITAAESPTFTVPNTSFPRPVPLTRQRVVIRPVVDVALVTRHSDHSLVGPVSRVNVAMIRGQLRTLHS